MMMNINYHLLKDSSDVVARLSFLSFSLFFSFSLLLRIFQRNGMKIRLAFFVWKARRWKICQLCFKKCHILSRLNARMTNFSMSHERPFFGSSRFDIFGPIPLLQKRRQDKTKKLFEAAAWFYFESCFKRCFSSPSLSLQVSKFWCCD